MSQDQDATRVAPPIAGGAAALLGTILAERYRLVALLGEGAQGAVYIGEHLKIGRRDAIKVLRPELLADADAVARFTRGASKACQISHPNVCTVYDFGDTADGLPFMASQLVDGCELQKLMEEEAPFPLTRAVDLTTQIAAGLHAAHELDIVHRDLKPANVMVQRAKDGRELAKVVDFDIAKGIGESEVSGVTQMGWIVGTPRYMSPEQMTGGELDGRSDIYSLALMLFEMLTGALPNTSTTTQRLMWERVNGRLLLLSELMPEADYPPALQAVLDRALASDANQRPATAGEFARELLEAVPEAQSHVGAPGLDTTEFLPAQPVRPGTRQAERTGTDSRRTASATGGAGFTPAADDAFPNAWPGGRHVRLAAAASVLVAVLAVGGFVLMDGGSSTVPTLEVPGSVELEVGAEHTLGIRLLDSSLGQPLAGSIEYETTDQTVAIVDTNGVLHGVAAGSTSVLVHAAGLTRQFVVTVSAPRTTVAADDPAQESSPPQTAATPPQSLARQERRDDTTTPAERTAPALAVTVPPHLSEALVMGNLHLDGARFQQAETVVAAALAELRELLRRHSGHAGLLDLQRKLRTLQQENRIACRAVSDVMGGECPAGTAAPER